MVKKKCFKGVNVQTDDFKLSCCVEPKGKNNTTKAVTMHGTIFLMRNILHKYLRIKMTLQANTHTHIETHNTQSGHINNSEDGEFKCIILSA